MADKKTLEARIVATGKTERLTATMKMVAAAKARKAAEDASGSADFNEGIQGLVSTLTERCKLEDTRDIPLLNSRPAKKVGLLIITGDRGLCGGYNAKLIRKAEARIAELKKIGVEPAIYSIGDKGSQYFIRGKYELSTEQLCGTVADANVVTEVVNQCVDDYLSGEIDRVELIYTAFTSMTKFDASIRTLIPFSVSEDGIEMEDDEIFRVTSKDGQLAVEKAEGSSASSSPEASSDTLLDQSPEFLMNAVLPIYLNGGLFSAWQNSIASELGARFVAMQAANDNAKDLKQALVTQLAKLRQAAITQEIAEIVSGTLASE
jgi:F-type H+-transporting ATPase subunit gamma